MAGTELGSAYISVGLGTNSLAGDIRRAFGSAESSGSSAGSAAGRGFGKAFGLIGGALATVGIGAFFKSAVSGAADLEQSVGAIDAVFKGSAGQMHEWAASAATDVGLSKNEFNELGTLIGAQLKNGGTAMEEIGPKTKDLIALGADLSSMFGGDASEAVGALSSALKGERDPIERYGVSLNQAKIDAEAAALGFSKVGGSLSAEANQAATLSLIMKQTADAHGNFARETDTLAHKQQVLNAQIADGKSRIGTELLPVVTALTGALSTALGPAIDGTVSVLKEINGGFAAMGAAFQAADGDITSSGFAGFMERVGLAAREVTGGVTAMFAAFKAGDGDITSSGFAGFMEQIGGTARQVFDALAPAIAQIMPLVASLVPQFMQLAAALSPTSLIFQILLPVLPQIAAAIGAVIAAVLPLVSSLASQLIPIITQLISAVLPMMIAIFSDVITAIAPLITQIADALIPIIDALLPVVVTVFTVVAAVVTSAMQIVQGIIQVVTGIITGNWRQVWDGIVNIVTGALRTVGNVLTGLKDIVVSALSGAGAWLVDSGKSLIQGFIDGISGMVGAIGDAVGGVMETVRDFFPFSPAKKGPFSGRGYTTYSGAALAGDFADSISAQRSKVEAAALAVTSAATLSGSFATTGAGSGSAAASGFNLPAFNVYIGNEQLDSRMFRVADTAIASADSSSQFSRRGR